MNLDGIDLDSKIFDGTNLKNTKFNGKNLEFLNP